MSSNNEVQLIATTGFGLEAVVARELKDLGYDDDVEVTVPGTPNRVEKTYPAHRPLSGAEPLVYNSSDG